MAMGHAGPGMAEAESDANYSPSRIRCVTKLIADAYVPEIEPKIPERVNTRTVFKRGMAARPEKLLIGQKLQGLLPEIPPYKAFSCVIIMSCMNESSDIPSSMRKSDNLGLCTEHTTCICWLLGSTFSRTKSGDIYL